MTQAEAVWERTVERFLECEAKRAEARAAALAEGKSEDQAREIAHEVAKAHWNAWAEDMLAKRKALEKNGTWVAEELLGMLAPKNAETRAWIEEAEAHFFRCSFPLLGDKGIQEAPGEGKEEPEPGSLSIKSIAIDGETTDLRGFIFPDTARFDTFSGNAWFDGATFKGHASFSSATFKGDASFDAATFSATARFDSAIFSGDTWFGNATFSDNASFDRATFKGNASFDSATFSATARFDSAIFSGDALFGNATFSGNAWFDSTTFSGNAWFARVTFSGDASFGSATFSGNSSFDSATFSGSAWFDNVTWSGNASFGSATFSDNNWFDGATFKGDALFGNATFVGSIRFKSVTFSGYAKFEDTTFSGVASFSNATFSEYARFDSSTFTEGAKFKSATFSKAASFRDVKFGSAYKGARANFTAIKVERAFDLTGASFSTVPSFSQADFKQAPDLDGVHFPLPDAEPAVIGDPSLIPKYRAIRRMAIQGADYESEHKAFKGELRSRRWCIDKWWHPSAWLGVLYDGIADCGRSITQPAIAWAATIIVFAAFYGSRALAGAEARCADGGGAFVQALYLSVKNGLVLFAGTRDARVNQAYVCLYGGTPDQPHIPPSVTFVETLLQFPISAVLIFLGLLAVKNRFKIK